MKKFFKTAKSAIINFLLRICVTFTMLTLKSFPAALAFTTGIISGCIIVYYAKPKVNIYGVGLIVVIIAATVAYFFYIFLIKLIRKTKFYQKVYNMQGLI